LPPGRLGTNGAYDNKTYSTKLGATVNDYLTLNYVARYTDAKLRFTGDEFGPPPDFKSHPASIQSEQVVHKFSTRGEAVVDPLNGRFVSYFGVNWIDTWNF